MYKRQVIGDVLHMDGAVFHHHILGSLQGVVGAAVGDASRVEPLHPLGQNVDALPVAVAEDDPLFGCVPRCV